MNSYFNELSKKSIKLKTESAIEEKICLVCFDKQCDAVFLECGHGG